MGISTRSKTGSLPAVAPTITKPKSTPRKAKSKTSTPKNGSSTPTTSAFPDLKLLSDSGTHVSTMSFFSDSTPGLLLFTYPKANTGGCTTQANGMNAIRDIASVAGYNIAGCSYDSVKSQAGWKAKHSMNITLLCDTLDSGLLKSLGAHKAPKSVKRSLFVMKKDGDNATVVVKKISISPKDCIAFVKEYIQKNPLVKDNKDEPKDKPSDKVQNAQQEDKVPDKTENDEKKEENKEDAPKESVADRKVATVDTMKDE